MLRRALARLNVQHRRRSDRIDPGSLLKRCAQHRCLERLSASTSTLWRTPRGSLKPAEHTRTGISAADSIICVFYSPPDGIYCRSDYDLFRTRQQPFLKDRRPIDVTFPKPVRQAIAKK